MEVLAKRLLEALVSGRQLPVACSCFPGGSLSVAIYERNEGVLIEASDIMAGPGYFRLRLHSADTGKGQAAMLGWHKASAPITLGDRETLLGVLCLSCSPTQALDARHLAQLQQLAVAMAPGFLQATQALRESVVQYVLQPVCGPTHAAGRKRPLPYGNPSHDRCNNREGEDPPGAGGPSAAAEARRRQYPGPGDATRAAAHARLAEAAAALSDSGNLAHHQHPELPLRQLELSTPPPPDTSKEAPLLSAESHSAASSEDSTWAASGVRRRTSTSQDSNLSSPRMQSVTPTSESSKPSSPQMGLLSARMVIKAETNPPGQSVGAQQPAAVPSLRQHAWLLHFWEPGVEAEFLLWTAQQRSMVQVVLEVISVATTACIALGGPAVMAQLQNHAVLAWGPLAPFIFLMLAQRTQWYRRNFEACQLAMYAGKVAWALLVVLSGIAETLRAPAPKALGTMSWRLQAPLLEAFSLMPLQHHVRFKTFAWFQLMWLALLVALVPGFCTLHHPHKPWLRWCSVKTACMLCMVGYFSVGAVLHSIDKAARNSFKHRKLSAHRRGTAAALAASR